MSTIFVDREDLELAVDGNVLVFLRDGQRAQQVPLALLRRVFLRGQVTVRTDFLAQLAARGIGVFIIAASGKVGNTLVASWPHTHPQRRIGQYALSCRQGFRVQLARLLLYERLLAECQSLADHTRLRPECAPVARALALLGGHATRLANMERLDSLRGLDGVASGTYEAALRTVVANAAVFDASKSDVTYALLDALRCTLRSLLLAETTLQLHATGFDPSIGFYHPLAPDTPALAHDLLQPLRADADRFCLRVASEGKLTPADIELSDGHWQLTPCGWSVFCTDYERMGAHLRTKAKRQVRQLEALIPAMPPGQASPVPAAQAAGQSGARA